MGFKLLYAKEVQEAGDLNVNIAHGGDAVVFGYDRLAGNVDTDPLVKSRHVPRVAAGRGACRSGRGLRRTFGRVKLLHLGVFGLR